MQLGSLEACLRYVLVDKAHSFDPVCKYEDLWSNALPLGRILHNPSNRHWDVDNVQYWEWCGLCY